MRHPKSQYPGMEGATLVDAANHLLWLLGSMGNRLHNATSPASVGEQKADALTIMDEAQPLIDALKALNVYRPDGSRAPAPSRLKSLADRQFEASTRGGTGTLCERRPVKLTQKAGKTFEAMSGDKDRCANCSAPFMDHANGSCPEY